MYRINPRVDFAFKKIFGVEENKDLLISLINAIVAEPDQVQEVILKNPYSLAAYREGKMSILDIKACNLSGQWYNIEMQISEDYHFDKRAIYYWAKLVTEQLSEGAMYKELKKTISINILDFNFIPQRVEFCNRYKIINVDSLQDDKLHDIFDLYYIELRKFNKLGKEITSSLDRWATFLSRAHQLSKNNLPAELANDPKICKAVDVVERLFDAEERQIYDVRMQALMDAESKIASAIEKGMELGLEKGMKQGKQESQKQIALKAYQAGLDRVLISEISGLSLDELQTLLDKNTH